MQVGYKSANDLYLVVANKYIYAPASGYKFIYVSVLYVRACYVICYMVLEWILLSVWKSL